MQDQTKPSIEQGYQRSPTYGKVRFETRRQMAETIASVGEYPRSKVASMEQATIAILLIPACKEILNRDIEAFIAYVNEQGPAIDTRLHEREYRLEAEAALYSHTMAELEFIREYLWEQACAAADVSSSPAMAKEWGKFKAQVIQKLHTWASPDPSPDPSPELTAVTPAGEKTKKRARKRAKPDPNAMGASGNVTKNAVAKFLGRSVRTIERMARDGKLPKVKTAKGTRFNVTSVKDSDVARQAYPK